MLGRETVRVRNVLPFLRSRRALCALGLTSALVLLALIRVSTAQSARRPVSPLQAATRALIEGRYEEVAALTEKLDRQDPNVVAVNARALIARGRYQEAEAALRPAAQRVPTSEAALELGLLMKMLGRPDASALLIRVAATAATADDGAQLARSARALRALSRFQEANGAYRDAAAALPRDPAVNTAWGDLFLEKYNKQEALKSYQAALQADSRWGPALLGAARALADDDPPQAASFAQKALAVNGSSVDAHVFLASQAVDASHRDEARKALKQALDVNPSSLDAHAMLAGLAYVEDNTPEFEAEVAKVLAIAPNYGEVYRVAGEQTAHNYRFDEAVVLVRRALTLDSDNPRALSDLGTHLLRTGDEPGARTVLEAAFKLDPFDVVTYNLLQMMDTLDKFVTVRDEQFILRMSKTEAPVLGEFAMSLAHQALDTLSKRYQFTPKGPILIEIFPKHDDFAVRNVGLPGMIGALGACFGRVVTLDSPHARTPGEFQWEATLWHELAHVITLQMSNQRLPRWLSEGVSVYEEKLARSDWARAQDMAFAQMLNDKQVITVKDLNASFNNPRTISIAYFEGSLLVDHLVKTFGDEGLHRLVRAYGQGLDTEAALKQALSTDFDRLQASFDEYLERNFGDLRRAVAVPDKDKDPRKMPLDTLRAYAAEHPKSYPVQIVFAGALRKNGNADEAIPVLERAALLAPVAAGPDSPHAQLADIFFEKKDRKRAISELQALMNVDFDNIEAPRKLVALYKDEGVVDPARLRPVYQRIVALDPFDADAQAAFGRLALGASDVDVAIRHLKAVVAIGPVDQAVAHTDLAEGYVKAGRRAEARKQTLAALEIAPSYERAQGLLLRLVEEPK